MKRIAYTQLSKHSQAELCSQFLRLYPTETVEILHLAFAKINPSAEFDPETGEWKVWEAHKDRFERILHENKERKA